MRFEGLYIILLVICIFLLVTWCLGIGHRGNLNVYNIIQFLLVICIFLQTGFKLAIKLDISSR